MQFLIRMGEQISDVPYGVQGLIVRSGDEMQPTCDFDLCMKGAERRVRSFKDSLRKRNSDGSHMELDQRLERLFKSRR